MMKMDDKKVTFHATGARPAWLVLVMALALGAAVFFSPAGAGSAMAAGPLCGNGSAPDYGFTYNLQQEHWTVGWQGYASEQAVRQVDAILDELNEDAIAQTMILIKPQAEVGNRVNCAVHFLRYMKLGLPAGERKDNGFVFLIVVEQDRIDVHYGVGLGLPALTAPELTKLNRAAEAAYASGQSMDQALLALVEGFEATARENYEPLLSPTAAPVTIDLPDLPAGPLGVFSLCCVTCVGIFILMFLLWLFIKLARLGLFRSTGSSYRRSRPFGGGSSWRGGGGGGFRPPPMRGGGGSGRSGRGN